MQPYDLILRLIVKLVETTTTKNAHIEKNRDGVQPGHLVTGWVMGLTMRLSITFITTAQAS